MKKHLTQDEKFDISRIVMDLETGNHLLYPRTKQYRELMCEVLDALDAEHKTPRQKEITETYNEMFYD